MGVQENRVPKMKTLCKEDSIKASVVPHLLSRFGDRCVVKVNMVKNVWRVNHTGAIPQNHINDMSVIFTMILAVTWNTFPCIELSFHVAFSRTFQGNHIRNQKCHEKNIAMLKADQSVCKAGKWHFVNFILQYHRNTALFKLSWVLQKGV